MQKVMGAEIVREHGVMHLLASTTAEARVAAFLLGLSERFTTRGYSPTPFILRMTRNEIGSYLGIDTTTVSRLFSKFRNERLISVAKKLIHIRDLAGLRRRTDGETG